MFRISAGSTLALALTLIASPGFASSHHSHRALHRVGHRLRHPLGQRGIAPERATEIQAALIHAEYLDGAPTGKWDTETEAAMQKYQADHGWQTKLTPDSRALIALGLGPSTASSEPLPANTYKSEAADSSEVGTLASVHSITQ